tara:strand:+ start:1435 stop:1962 length:528 start_codon:yes stop_codon:yes gene_type:complete
MSWVAVAVSAVNVGSSIVSKRQAKKDAKNQRIKNEKIERMNNILDVLGGGTARGFNSNQQAITGSTFADILSGAGSIGQAAGSAIQQKAQKKIDADAVTQKNKVDASLINARDASALADLMSALNAGGTGSKSGSRNGGSRGIDRFAFPRSNEDSLVPFPRDARIPFRDGLRENF